jgi:hypothetical protein
MVASGQFARAAGFLARGIAPELSFCFTIARERSRCRTQVCHSVSGSPTIRPVALGVVLGVVLGSRCEYRGSDLQLNARSKPYSRVDLKLTIAVLIAVALAIGMALFVKYLINR